MDVDYNYIWTYNYFMMFLLLDRSWFYEFQKATAVLLSGAIMFSSVGFSEFPVQAVKTMLSASAEDIVDSGTCGENLTWTLDSEETLTISGTGEMYMLGVDYSYQLSAFKVLL